jgi:DNA replication and repair protein RecF
VRLHRVRIQNFRRLGEVTAELGPGLNWVWGDNAAGKSSFLEALLLLGRGRNHRGSPADAVGAAGAAWRVEATVRSWAEAGVFAQLLITAGHGRSERRLDGRAVNQLTLAQTLPVVLLEPESHGLVGEGPTQRRRYIDWGVFHVEHPYASLYLRWQRLLKQRNAALRRAAAVAEVMAWDEELGVTGEAIDGARRRHLQQLQPLLLEQLQVLVGDGPWTLEWRPGWNEPLGLAAALQGALETDRLRRLTSVGPQRAEFSIRRDAQEARRRVSRGEEKLLAAALLLAQRQLLQKARSVSAILLVDDFASELGDAAQARLLQALQAQPGQCVLTDLRPPAAAAAPPWVFHVEHGRVRPMVE